MVASRTTIRVPPRLCDAQGMMHAIRYHELIEDAFLAWLDHRSLPYDDLRAAGIDLVIGTSTIRYRAPARLGDDVVVEVDATASTRSTVTVGITFRRDDVVLAEAEITYVAVRDGRSTSVPTPLVPADRA